MFFDEIFKKYQQQHNEQMIKFGGDLDLKTEIFYRNLYVILVVLVLRSNLSMFCIFALYCIFFSQHNISL